MRHEETRDNTTAIEANLSEADANADTREEVFGRPVRPFRQPEERHEEHNDGANGYDEGGVAEALFGQRHFGGNDPQDPEHDPIGDAETEYDIEYDDEPEDDGQPSEYEEWQDYMGGDDWDFGQYDQGGY